MSRLKNAPRTIAVPHLKNALTPTEQDILKAIAAGETCVRCVAKVDRKTRWTSDFLALVDHLRQKYETRIRIESGLEVAILNADGDLDLPLLETEPDHLLVRLEGFPYGHYRYAPHHIRGFWEDERESQTTLYRHYFRALIGAMWKHQHVILVDPLSLLSQAGLAEEDAPIEYLAGLCRAMNETQSHMMVSGLLYEPGGDAVRFLQVFGLNRENKHRMPPPRFIPTYRYTPEQLYSANAVYDLAA